MKYLMMDSLTKRTRTLLDELDKIYHNGHEPDTHGEYVGVHNTGGRTPMIIPPETQISLDNKNNWKVCRVILLRAGEGDRLGMSHHRLRNNYSGILIVQKQ